MIVTKLQQLKLNIVCAISHIASRLLDAVFIIAIIGIAGCVNGEVDRTQQQVAFLQAEQALAEGRQGDYQQLKQSLQGYPLLQYLDYKEAQDALVNGAEDVASRFLQTYPNTRLANRLRNIWLPKLADQERWREFLDITPKYVRTTELRCQQLAALIAIGKSQQAFRQIKPLWLVGKPQPYVCNTIFDAWEKSGLLTADLAWQRIALAIKEGQPILAQSLKRLLRPEEQIWVEQWLRIDQNPQLIYNTGEFANPHPWRESILIFGLEQLARKRPKEAAAAWEMLKQHYTFNEQQIETARHTVALAYLRFATPEMLEGITAIDGILDIDIQKRRIMQSIVQGRWDNVATRIDTLPPKEKDIPKWRYWQGRALQQMGRSNEAKTLLKQVAQDRTYYAFLAADRAGLDYYLMDKTLNIETNLFNEIANRNAALCAQELLAIGRTKEANLEWLWLTQNLTPQELQAAAKLANQWGWHDQAIFTLAKSDVWDDLQLRFPLEHLSLVKQHARTYSLPVPWIFAVIRQESTFSLVATSPSGALGLMQLMPPTAKQVAQKLGQPLPNIKNLFRPEVNITLGTSYLNEVAQKFHNNLVLATAAYNAGPNRVMKWLPNKTMDADVWVETIPYQETRTYVQRVMAYMVLYEHRLKMKPSSIVERMSPIQPVQNFR